ncbi:probable CDP-diacylglycerol--inositol 3-phosphatidyltransferase 2 isoform X2 [Benincasa hispida]|uniref:probable CDP-diacylglycerol--inositol 3-phosphatidyltransferase 2 isoform X2 n=1 Tax=Benincasa hispida TaxID=102211 RepID=UPI001902AE5D|nr:probable CDP-diacylglycerol--inositol 3-phosphatidyltransferase 2 isoform X2 [Benincasa hispida]
MRWYRWLVCSQIQSSFHVWGCAGHGNRPNLLYHRISTACLLVILSQVYRPGLIFVSLLALDIASHWLQMYSTFLIGKASHKDVKDSTNWLFKAYYGNRTFMAYCCVSCEVLYIILFLLAETQNENLMDVILHSIQQKSFLSLLVVISLFGWAVKQAVNVIQNSFPFREANGIALTVFIHRTLALSLKNHPKRTSAINLSARHQLWFTPLPSQPKRFYTLAAKSSHDEVLGGREFPHF